MKEILTALVAFCYDQSLALEATASHASGMEMALRFHYPEMEDELNARIELAKEKNREYVDKARKTLSQLQEAVSRLSD
jgi:hypothetical protein